jgi:hypothetical protein
MNRCTIIDPTRLSLVLKMSEAVIVNCWKPEHPMTPVELPDALTVRLIKLVVENHFVINKQLVSGQFLRYVHLLCD